MRGLWEYTGRLEDPVLVSSDPSINSSVYRVALVSKC